MERVITFENEVQARLFELKLRGQFSDGMWENAKPIDHWIPWAEAKVRVGSSGGRNFSVRKDSYDITSYELLDAIGEEMLNICNMTENNYSLEIVENFHYILDGSPIDKGELGISILIPIDATEEIVMERAKTKFGGNYWRERYNEVINTFGSVENLRKAYQGSYDMAKLRKELRAIKRIMKTKL